MRALLDILDQVYQSITANKLRSFLTMFGIAWGVASLLLLIGLGEGFRSGQRRGLSELGTDVIMIFGGTIPALPNQHTGMMPYKLTFSDAEAILQQAPASPQRHGHHQSRRPQAGQRVLERRRSRHGGSGELS
jgi:putative ABC transport system permease protein